MPPLTVDEDEAIAMVVALNGAAQLTAGARSGASVSALSKVVQVLPPELRRRAEALRSVTDDSPFSEAPAVRADVLAAVAQATRDTDAAAYVRKGLSPNETGAVVRALVHAPAEEVRPRIARWATVTPRDDRTCHIEMEANDARWAEFGLGVIEAPFEIVSAPPAVTEILADWASLFTAAAGKAGTAAGTPAGPDA